MIADGEQMYVCDKGHVIKLGNGKVFLHVNDGQGQSFNYDFCWLCYGEWLSQQFPIRKQTE